MNRRKSSISVEEEMRRRDELRKEGLHEGGNHHQSATTMCLFSGGAVDFLAPDASQIKLDDIARGLAYSGRFFGQTRTMLTVAEHSILVKEIYRALYPHATLAELRYALCHDAHEGLIGDFGSPLKRALEQLAGKPIIKMLDELVEPVVWEALGLGSPSPLMLERVKRCDLRARFCEGHVMCPEELCWEGPDAKLPDGVTWFFGMEPEDAREAWLYECEQLGITAGGTV